MSNAQDPVHIAEMTSRLERLEQIALDTASSARTWRDPPTSPAGYRDPRLETPGPALARARRTAPGVNPWLFVMATMLNTMVAAVLAVIITLGVVRQDRPEGQQQASLSATAAPRSTLGYGGETPRMPTAQFLSLRPIGSSDQPLRLEARKPARLPLQIQPEEAAYEPFIVVLAGVPAGTLLSGAQRIGSDTWFLPPGSVSRLEITFPEWSATPFEVAVELRRTNGQVAGQTKAWIAVPPPAGPETVGTIVDEAATKELLARGDQLLERGDIVAARAVYQRAAEMGNSTAALTLGSTYDPNRLWSLGALSMVGNKERAKFWYSRASDLGHPDARNRLRLLGN